MYTFQSQVLISEAGGDQKMHINSKAGGDSVKNDKAKDASESHVEMDSRLLSVLLTVSINIFTPAYKVWINVIKFLIVTVVRKYAKNSCSLNRLLI